MKVRAHAHDVNNYVREHAIPGTMRFMATRKKLAGDAWGALLRVHAAVVPALDNALEARTSLPLAWYDVLLELASEPERRLRMSDLGERVTLSRTRVSRIVDELVAKGYVEKQEHPDDRRSSFAALTRAGEKAFRTAAPIYMGEIEEQFAAGLSAAELERLASLLNGVLAHRADSRALIT